MDSVQIIIPRHVCENPKSKHHSNKKYRVLSVLETYDIANKSKLSSARSKRAMQKFRTFSHAMYPRSNDHNWRSWDSSGNESINSQVKESLEKGRYAWTLGSKLYVGIIHGCESWFL